MVGKSQILDILAGEIDVSPQIICCFDRTTGMSNDVGHEGRFGGKNQNWPVRRGLQ